MKEFFKLKNEKFTGLIATSVIVVFLGLCAIGLLFNGWKDTSDGLYYKAWGKTYTGTQTINGKDYIFSDDGRLFLGWFEYNGKLYYQDRGGIYKGERIIEGETYSFNDDGELKSGLYTLDGEDIVRLNDSKGMPLFGEVNYKGNIYLVDEDGVLLYGWRGLKGPYYDRTTGNKAVGLTEIDGDTYFFDDKGYFQTGWVNFEEGKRYFDEDGKMLIGPCIVGSKPYCFGEDGISSVGFVNIGDNLYYALETGELFCGWIHLEKGYMYFDNTGVALDGFVTLENDSYYFVDRYMQTGWITIDNKERLFGDDGKMRTGFQMKDGKTIYLLPEDGTIAKGDVLVSGVKYHFEDDGTYKSGWIDGVHYNRGYLSTGVVTIDGVTYFFDQNGKISDGGWKFVNGQAYHYKDDGTADVGMTSIDGKNYFFDFTGKMMKGFVMTQFGRVYFNPANGQAVSGGWMTIDGERYYFNDNGTVTTGLVLIDGKWCFFSETGALKKGKVNTPKGIYYINQEGEMAVNTWLTLDNKKLYAGNDGKLFVGWNTIDGNTYYFSNEAIMLTGWRTINGKLYYFYDDGILAKDTIIGQYSIDPDGVATNRFATVNDDNLDEYLDYILATYGSSLRNIFDYVRGTYPSYYYRYKIVFNDDPNQPNVRAMALRMINYGNGACWDYASLTYLLVTKAGYNAKIIIGKGAVFSEHNWLVIEVEPGVWRHLDTERIGYEVFLVTDEWLDERNKLFVNNGRTDSRYDWDHSRWPNAV